MCIPLSPSASQAAAFTVVGVSSGSPRGLKKKCKNEEMYINKPRFKPRFCLEEHGFTSSQAESPSSEEPLIGIFQPTVILRHLGADGK